MTDQQSNPGAESPVPDLQPITFQPIQDDGQKAIYRALIYGRNAPRGAVCSLTVTVASPITDQDKQELQAFLEGMRAGLVLLPEPNPGDGMPEDPGPFDPDTIRFELELLEPTGPGPFGVAVTVETTTGLDPGIKTTTGPAPEGKSRPAEDKHGVVLAGRDQFWSASGGAPLKGTVTPSGGSGNIRSPRTPPKDVSPDHPGSLRATEIQVHGYKRMPYGISNFFNGPSNKP
jgi:hypothetical protein